ELHVLQVRAVGIPGREAERLELGLHVGDGLLFTGRARRASFHGVGGEILDVLEELGGVDHFLRAVGVGHRDGAAGRALRRGELAGGQRSGDEQQGGNGQTHEQRRQRERERDRERARARERTEAIEVSGCAASVRAFHRSTVLPFYRSTVLPFYRPCHDPYIGFGRMKNRRPNWASAFGSVRLACDSPGKSRILSPTQATTRSGGMPGAAVPCSTRAKRGFLSD